MVFGHDRYSVCLLFVAGLFCVCVHCHWELSTSATVWIVTAVCMWYSTCVLDGGPVLCAGTPESPEERADSQGVETMGGGVPPQQPEQAGPSRGGVQPHLEEERCVGLGKAHVHIFPI